MLAHCLFKKYDMLISIIHLCIGLIVCKGARLITGSTGHRLCLWSAVGISEMRLPGDHHNLRSGGLTIDDEMTLDGVITAGCFDDTLDMVQLCS